MNATEYLLALAAIQIDAGAQFTALASEGITDEAVLSDRAEQVLADVEAKIADLPTELT